ncbi:sulfite exporter TauE/SafE family protein [Endozoicomonadaceae bacterium StTr2]
MITPDQLVLFSLISFAAAFVSTLIGFGGGIIMLILLSFLVPARELVAVVGLVQLGALISRFYIFRADINYRFCGEFVLGAVPGVLLAGMIFTGMNSQMLSAVLGVYLIYAAWEPRGIPVHKLPGGMFFSGGVLAFISFFVGAPGPSAAAILKTAIPAKKALIGTLTGCLLGQSLVKMAGFYAAGFPFEAWLLPGVVMIAAGLPGSVLGYRVMDRINDRTVHRVVRIIMALAGVNLLIKSLL